MDREDFGQVNLRVRRYIPSCYGKYQKYIPSFYFKEDEKSDGGRHVAPVRKTRHLINGRKAIRGTYGF